MSSNIGTNEPRNLSLVKKFFVIHCLHSLILYPRYHQVAHEVTIASSGILKTCFARARMRLLSNPNSAQVRKGRVLDVCIFYTLFFHLLEQCGHSQGSPRKGFCISKPTSGMITFLNVKTNYPSPCGLFRSLGK